MAVQFNNLFFSIGAMKAGTTWLYAALSTHPQLMFCPEKEIHYFHDRDLGSDRLRLATRHRRARRKYIPILRGDMGRKEHAQSHWQRSVQLLRDKTARHGMPDLTGLAPEAQDWVRAYLSEPVDDAWFKGLFPSDRPDAYACEFSNLSALLPAKTWRDIAARSTKLRVLYTLRDPVDRLWSHVKFELEMTKRLNLLETWGPGDFERFARRPEMWAHGEYGQICERLQQNLPAEALRIQSYEDMQPKPMTLIRDIERFLGVAAHRYPDWLLTRRPVKSKSIPMPDFFRDLFAQDVARIKGELSDLGIDAARNWG